MSQIAIRSVQAHDPEAVSAYWRPRDRRFVPAGSSFDIRGDFLSLDRIALVRETTGTEMSVFGAPPPGRRSLAVVLDGASPSTGIGHRFDTRHMMLTEDGAEWALEARPGSQYAHVAFDRDTLAAHVADTIGTGAEVRLPPGQMMLSVPAVTQRLATVLRNAWAQIDRVAPEALPAVGPRLEESVLDALVGAFAVLRDAAARVPGGSRRRLAFERAVAYAERERPAATVTDLCRAADVSRRTLEYAFREVLGFGPARFLRERRLEAARGDLLQTDPRAGGLVTNVALHWGFTDMGHFAGDYRRRFGELPSETMRRAR